MPSSAHPDASKKLILVPVDFEPASRAALIFGARMAACTGAPLKILHVVHEPGDKPNYYRRRGRKDAILPIHELAEVRLKEFLLDVYETNPDLQLLSAPDVYMVAGLPFTRIPEVAERLNAGLIAMGHENKRGLPGSLFASLSERVANNCSVPVTVVYSNGVTQGVVGDTGDDFAPIAPGMALGA